MLGSILTFSIRLNRCPEMNFLKKINFRKLFCQNSLHRQISEDPFRTKLSKRKEALFKNKILTM